MLRVNPAAAMGINFAGKREVFMAGNISDTGGGGGCFHKHNFMEVASFYGGEAYVMLLVMAATWPRLLLPNFMGLKTSVTLLVTAAMWPSIHYMAEATTEPTTDRQTDGHSHRTKPPVAGD